MQAVSFDVDCLFYLVNGFTKENVAGMLYEFRHLPVVILDYQGRPERISPEIFYLKKCKLLMLGEVIWYDKCKLKIIQYEDSVSFSKQ